MKKELILIQKHDESNTNFIERCLNASENCEVHGYTNDGRVFKMSTPQLNKRKIKLTVP